jgi:hypothetical protein
MVRNSQRLPPLNPYDRKQFPDIPFLLHYRQHLWLQDKYIHTILLNNAQWLPLYILLIFPSFSPHFLQDKLKLLKIFSAWKINFAASIIKAEEDAQQNLLPD